MKKNKAAGNICFAQNLKLAIISGLTCLILAACGEAGNFVATTFQTYGNVLIPTPSISGAGSSEESGADIAASIEQFWTAWLSQDAETTLASVSEEILYISQQTGQRASGHQELGLIFSEEWRAYEQSEGIIAMNIDISDLEIEIQEDAAKVTYWINSIGGVRWDFDDQAFVSQYFQKEEGNWKLIYHTDSWGLNYDSDSAGAFDYDYVYPVEDLSRAEAFYTPLFGEPEAVFQDRVTYFLEGSRFHLYDSSLGGYVKLQDQLPSAYAIFQVNDLDSEVVRLEAAGVPVVHTTTLYSQDPVTVFEDPSGNIFAMMEKVYDVDAVEGPRFSSVFPAGAVSELAEDVAYASANTDADYLQSYLNQESVWFDDSRLRSRGVAQGANAIMSLVAKDWDQFDRSIQGIAAEFEPSQFVEIEIGPWRLASFQMRKTGLGSHPFSETAWVTYCFDSDEYLCSAFTSRANGTGSFVTELDHTAHPVLDLDKAYNFYKDVMNLGEPYTDTDWYGYWGTHSVYGIYLSDPAEDGFPRPSASNGYVSLWVESAEDTYAYLQSQDVDFPIISAINEVSGIDVQPGYTQILSTDSEGNLLIFTQYIER